MKGKEISEILESCSEVRDGEMVIPSSRFFEIVDRVMELHTIVDDVKISDVKLMDTFEVFRLEFKKASGTLGRVRGLETEWRDFRRKHKDFREIVPILSESLAKEIEWRYANRDSDPRKVFVPYWKNLKTWLGNRCWEIEYVIEPVKKGNDDFYSS